jgi:hypothetical protein
VGWANHRIVTNLGQRKAGELSRNDMVVVGDRMRPLANVRKFQEGVELYDVRFEPNAPIEAYSIGRPHPTPPHPKTNMSYMDVWGVLIGPRGAETPYAIFGPRVH